MVLEIDRREYAYGTTGALRLIIFGPPGAHVFHLENIKPDGTWKVVARIADVDQAKCFREAFEVLCDTNRRLGIEIREQLRRRKSAEQPPT